MPGLYLTPWRGSGTRADPFRADGADIPGSGSIDLRPDPTSVDGFALVYRPNDLASLAQNKIGDDIKATFGTAVRNRVANRLGVDLAGVSRFDVLAAKLLRQPPVNGWNALLPNRREMRYEIWLAGLLVWEEPWITGGATDDFNRANETPLAAPWSIQAGSGSTLNLSGNGVVLAAEVGSGTSYFYTGAAVTADQFSACKPIANGFAQGGPFVRCAVTGYSGYGLDPAFNQLLKYISGSPTLLGSSLTPDIQANDLLRVEAEGTTIRAFLNGVQMTGSPSTDSSLTTAGSGVGIYLGEASQKLDDWEGNDLTPPPSTDVSIAWIRA